MMINPISFRAGVAPIVMDAPTKPEETKTEVVTAPVEAAASFKGADALAAYNKAILAADDNAEVKAPAFRGEEVAETEVKAPAFRGEEVEETEPKTPAFKGEEVEETEAKAPAFRGEEVEETEAKAPAFKGEEVAETEAKAPAFKGEEVPAEDAEVEKDAEKTEA